MKIENSFTIEDVHGFMDGYADRERRVLAQRLQRVSDSLAEIGPRVTREASDDPQWSAHETLAHIAVVSKFYGVMVHKIATGQMSDTGIVDAVNMRDAAAKQMVEFGPEDLVRMARADHERTIHTLLTAGLDALRRTARLDDGTEMSAEEVARLPLISHLEAHVEDLERMVGPKRL